MKVTSVAQLLALVSAANQLDGIFLYNRHGARTTLRDFGSPTDDYKFQEEFGLLTPAGYSQAIQVGSRYYLQYRSYFEGMRWGESENLKAISSDILRSWETGVGMMEGWNLIVDKEGVAFERSSNHFSEGPFAPMADKEGALFKSVKDRADILHPLQTPRGLLLAKQGMATKLVTNWVKRNQAVADKLFAAVDFKNSQICASKGPLASKCQSLMTMKDFGSYVATAIVLDYHSQHSELMPPFRQHPDLFPADVREKMDELATYDLAQYFLGRGGEIVFADAVQEALTATQEHLRTGKNPSAPLMELMMTHDSAITGFLLGFGLKPWQLPKCFFADGIAIETSFKHRNGDLDGACMRFLWNGLQPFISDKFAPCSGRSDLSGQGWYAAEDLAAFAAKVHNATPEEDNEANREQLKEFGYEPVEGAALMQALYEDEDLGKYVARMGGLPALQAYMAGPSSVEAEERQAEAFAEERI